MVSYERNDTEHLEEVLMSVHSVDNDARMHVQPDQNPKIEDGSTFRMSDVEVYCTQLSIGGPRAMGAFRVENLEFRFWKWNHSETEWRIQASYRTIPGDRLQYHTVGQTRTEVSFTLPVELASGGVHLVQLRAPSDQAAHPDGAGPFRQNPTVFEWRVQLPERPIMLKKDHPELQCDWDGQVIRG
jgi:hypothetical protein